MNETISILLADDHPVIRKGLRSLIEAETGLSVAGEAADGLQAMELVQKLQPDVLVVDVMMPGMSGLEVTSQVLAVAPKTRVIILSMHASEPSVLTALRNGAAAYVLKEGQAGEVIRAIREVSAGRRYLSPPLSLAALQTYLWDQEGAYLKGL